MGRILKKFERGAAVAFISRTRAIKKLQLSLKDFRRLCILKGVHPHQPKNPKKAGKGAHSPTTYYLLKDIQYLSHEPIIDKFREHKHFVRRLKRAIGRSESDTAARVRINRPRYKLDHIVRERYPSLDDAIRDLDDCLCLVSLFAAFPTTFNSKVQYTSLCARLSSEFLNYVVNTRSLRRVFISIKGFYFEADVRGSPVTWVMRHKFTFERPPDVDYRILSTFVEFYVTMLGFVNCHLYHDAGIVYPPVPETSILSAKRGGQNDSKRKRKLAREAAPDEPVLCHKTERNRQLVASLAVGLKKREDHRNREELAEAERDEREMVALQPVTNAEEERIKAERMSTERLQHLFDGQKFFLNREIPKEVFVFAIRACGGEVSWHADEGVGSTFKEDDADVNFQIIDRPLPSEAKQHLQRHYVQPQWVFDSINAQRLLPVDEYLPGALLPPHLSPFITDSVDIDQLPLSGVTLSGKERQVVQEADANTASLTAVKKLMKKQKAGDEGRLVSAQEDDEYQDVAPREDDDESSDDSDDQSDGDENEVVIDDRTDESSVDEGSDTDEDSGDGASDENGEKEDEEDPMRPTQREMRSAKEKLAVSAGAPPKPVTAAAKKVEELKALKMNEALIPRKQRRLYQKLKYREEREATEKRKLAAKRDIKRVAEAKQKRNAKGR